MCDYVDYLLVLLLLTSVNGGGSGVWATEQTVFGCSERRPAAQEVPVPDVCLAWLRDRWRT